MAVLPQSFRRRRNYFLARAVELLRPVHAWSARTWRHQRPTAPSTWRRGLLIGADHIGDVLYTTPSLPYLKGGLPECEWHFLASPPATEVLETNPWVKICSREEVKAYNFDVVVCYNSAMYWRDLLFALNLKAPNVVAYVHKGFSGLVTYPIDIRFPQPYPAYFRDLIAQLTGLRPDWPLRPLVYPTNADVEQAEKLRSDLQLAPERPTIACFITTRQPVRTSQWEHLAETLQLVTSRVPAQVVLCGARSDAAVLQEFRDRHRLTFPINPGALGLRALAAFLGQCQVVITADSGPRHLANAAGAPVLFFRNLSSHPTETGRYLPTETDLASDAETLLPDARGASTEHVAPREAAERILKILNTTG